MLLEALVGFCKAFLVLWRDLGGFGRIVRGFRGLLEALVGFCKASEDFEGFWRHWEGHFDGFCRLLEGF